MSIQSMLDLAAERDARTPRKTGIRGTRAAEAGDEGPSNADLLVKSIPTEVLAPYTALVGGVVATIGPKESPEAALRWGLYVGGLVAIAIWFAGVYMRTAAKKRKFPLAEALAALIAFGAWGLVMPASPLSIDVTGDDLTRWTLIITAAGAFLVGVLVGPQLKKPVKD